MRISFFFDNLLDKIVSREKGVGDILKALSSLKHKPKVVDIQLGISFPFSCLVFLFLDVEEADRDRSAIERTCTLFLRDKNNPFVIKFNGIPFGNTDIEIELTPGARHEMHVEIRRSQFF